MDRLPEGERAVLELVALDELTVAEAAAATGVRPVTARVRLHRARGKLRAELEAAPTETTASEGDGS
jgi:RNA polymerase sigma-70 factor (ECF subfamily)